MKKPGLSDRERRVLEDARRQAAAKRGAAPAAPSPRAAPAQPAAAPAASSPLDGRTVIGWDHPAARATPRDQPAAAGRTPSAAQSAPDADAKWSQIAVLMEAERTAANEKRQRMKRAAIIFVGVVVVLALIVATRLILKR